MRAPGAIHELKVDEYRLPVTAEPDRHLRGAHLIEVKRRITLCSDRPRHGSPRQRRNVHLRLNSRHGHLCDFANLSWQRTLLDQENV